MKTTSTMTWLSSYSEKIISCSFKHEKYGISINTVLYVCITSLYIPVHLYTCIPIIYTHDYLKIWRPELEHLFLPLFPSSKLIAVDTIIFNSTGVNQIPSSFQVVSLCSISPASLTPFIAKFLSLLHSNTHQKNPPTKPNNPPPPQNQETYTHLLSVIRNYYPEGLNIWYIGLLINLFIWGRINFILLLIA